MASEISQGLVDMISLRRDDATIITGVHIHEIAGSAILSTVLVKDFLIRILLLMTLFKEVLVVHLLSALRGHLNMRHGTMHI